MDSAGRERWRRVQEVFDGAADLRPDRQAAHLAAECAGDDALRREVEALLRSDAEAGGFIENAIRRGSDLLLGAEPDPLAAVGTIGKYEILGRIGEGGFGVVYKGRDAVLQRYVAVKTCSSSDEKLRRRFFREGQIAAGLQHPNITTVHDLGVERGIPYLVQEFLAGEDLNHKIARHETLPPLRRLDILVQVARGLEYAHMQGVLHRDVKPANIRILPSGTVKIMDFGIAKLLHEVSDVTTQGVTVGTVGYLAPEQLRGEEVDRRTDIFSFGVLAYELLTYERPFKGSTFSEVSYRLLNEEPPALRDLAPLHGRVVAELTERCLAKEPAQRFTDFGEIVALIEPELAALRSGPVPVVAPADAGRAATAVPGGDRRPDRRPARQGRTVARPWLAAAAVIAVLTTGLGWRLMRQERPGLPGAVQTAAAGRSAPGSATPAGGAVPTGGARSPEGATSTGGAAAMGSAVGARAGARQPAAPAAPKAATRAASGRATPGGTVGGTGGSAAMAPERHGSDIGTHAGSSAGPATPANPANSAPAEATPGGPAASAVAGTAVETAGTATVRPPLAGADPAAGPGGAAAVRAARPDPYAAPQGAAQGAAGDEPEDGQPPGSVASGAPLGPMVRGDLIPPGAPGAVPPRLLSRSEPLYPDRARRRQVEANVLMLVLVDENGHVIRAIVKQTDDPGLGFNEAARRAALRASFSPASRDGLPGKMWTELPFSFRLHQGG